MTIPGVDRTAFIAGSATLGEEVAVGFSSCVGFGADSNTAPTTIGDRSSVGCFCVVHAGATVAADVEIDHYCRIGTGASVGPNSKILYGVAVFNNAVIGANCIVGGDVSERTVLEDFVTFSGDIAHSHRDASLDWDTTDEESPRILRGSVVGVRALIIGGVSIGPYSYVGANEVVRTDIPAETVLAHGELTPLSSWRGFIKVRGRGETS